VSVDLLRRLIVNISVELEPGDALLIRTGWLAAWRAGQADASAWPGLDPDCAEFLAERQVALIGADNLGVEVFPSPDPDCQVPLHVNLLRGHGIYFCELLDLDELAAAKRPTFLLAIAPLPIIGAVGGPVSPIAVV
jgi:kynurenine formamidase